MASIILRTLSPQVHRALKARAAQSGRTVEAEIVEIVEIAVRGKVAGGMGVDFAEIMRNAGWADLESPVPAKASPRTSSLRRRTTAAKAMVEAAAFLPAMTGMTRRSHRFTQSAAAAVCRSSAG